MHNRCQQTSVTALKSQIEIFKNSIRRIDGSSVSIQVIINQRLRQTSRSAIVYITGSQITAQIMNHTIRYRILLPENNLCHIRQVF